MSPITISFAEHQFSGLSMTFGQFQEVIQGVARDTITTLRNLVEGASPVGEKDRDPHRGLLKRSWGLVQEQPLSLSFASEVPYAHVLEEGLYPNVGPRTMPGQGIEGIFSRQAPRGMLRPLVEDDNLVDRITAYLMKRIVERLGPGV